MKRKIKLNISELKLYIKEGIEKLIENIDFDKLRVEDYFNINSLSKEDVLSISNDIRIFIGGQIFNSGLNRNGKLIHEEKVLPMSVDELRSELSKIGFQPWQIESRIYANKVKVIILFADIAKNLEIIVNKMLSCGWTKAHISEPVMAHGVLLRAIDFDPIEQDSLSDEARQYFYLYHWTPYENLVSILNKGIQIRNNNNYFSYPPKVHLMKGDVSKSDASKLGWLLFNANSSLNNGRYALLRINIKKVPENIEFYGDPRYEHGYFTKDNIPSNAIELFGEITYKDKYNYNNEKIKFILPNDSMIKD